MLKENRMLSGWVSIGLPPGKYCSLVVFMTKRALLVKRYLPVILKLPIFRSVMIIVLSALKVIYF